MTEFNFLGARRTLKMSLRAVARKIGVNRSVITALERGNDVRLSNYIKIRKFYEEELKKRESGYKTVKKLEDFYTKLIKEKSLNETEIL